MDSKADKYRQLAEEAEARRKKPKTGKPKILGVKLLSIGALWQRKQSAMVGEAA